MTIRVLIADDHPLVRSGICTELGRSNGFEVIGEATSGDAALRLAHDLRPDVLLLDINMPGLRAYKVLRGLKQTPSPCKVLILTAYSDRDTITAMMAAGADGYLLKDEDPRLVSEAIEAVANGKIWYSPSISLEMDAPPNPLTQRECEIIQLLVEGHANKEIAQKLDISERTIEFHCGNIMQKLGVVSRLEVAVWGKEHQHLLVP